MTSYRRHVTGGTGVTSVVIVISDIKEGNQPCNIILDLSLKGSKWLLYILWLVAWANGFMVKNYPRVDN